MPTSNRITKNTERRRRKSNEVISYEGMYLFSNFVSINKFKSL